LSVDKSAAALIRMKAAEEALDYPAPRAHPGRGFSSAVISGSETLAGGRPTVIA